VKEDDKPEERPQENNDVSVKTHWPIHPPTHATRPQQPGVVNLCTCMRKALREFESACVRVFIAPMCRWPSMYVHHSTPPLTPSRCNQSHFITHVFHTHTCCTRTPRREDAPTPTPRYMRRHTHAPNIDQSTPTCQKFQQTGATTLMHAARCPPLPHLRALLHALTRTYLLAHVHQLTSVVHPQA
jgi:hypothetical protein